MHPRVLSRLLLVLTIGACCKGSSTRIGALNSAGKYCNDQGLVLDKGDITQTAPNCFKHSQPKCAGIGGGTPPIISTIPDRGV